MKIYSILSDAWTLIEEYESEDYSAKHQAIKAAKILAKEGQRPYFVQNDKTEFLWIINTDGSVSSLGIPKPSDNGATHNGTPSET